MCSSAHSCSVKEFSMRSKPASPLREQQLRSYLTCVCVFVYVSAFVFLYKVKLIRRGSLPEAGSIEAEWIEAMLCILSVKAAGLVLQAGEVTELQPTEAQCLTANRHDWQIISSPGFTVLCLIMKWASVPLGECAEIRRWLKSSQVRFIDWLGVEVRGQLSWVTQLGFTKAKKPVMKGKLLFYILGLAGKYLGRKGIIYSE